MSFLEKFQGKFQLMTKQGIISGPNDQSAYYKNSQCKNFQHNFDKKSTQELQQQNEKQKNMIKQNTLQQQFFTVSQEKPQLQAMLTKQEEELQKIIQHQNLQSKNSTRSKFNYVDYNNKLQYNFKQSNTEGSGFNLDQMKSFREPLMNFNQQNYYSKFKQTNRQSAFLKTNSYLDNKNCNINSVQKNSAQTLLNDYNYIKNELNDYQKLNVLNQELEEKQKENIKKIGQRRLTGGEQFNENLKRPFRPYSMEQFKEIKNIQGLQLGGLGPNIDSEKWKKSKEMYMKADEYSERVQQFNMLKLRDQQLKKDQNQQNQQKDNKQSFIQNSRQKALDFAKLIPRPKQIGMKIDQQKDQLLKYQGIKLTPELDQLELQHLQFLEKLDRIN